MAQGNNGKTKKDHTKIGAVIILIISAIVFIPFGGYEVFNAIFRSNKGLVFGKYDGKKIAYEPGSLFYNITTNSANRMKAMGYEVNDYYIFMQAFEETVKDMAYLEKVEKSGYSVPEEAVNRRLINYYLDTDGNYSARLYNQTDKATRDSYHDGVEKSLAYSRYEEDILGDGAGLYGLTVSSKEIPFINSMSRDQHAFSLVTFNTENFPKEEAADWASDNMDKFVKYQLSAISVESEDEANTLLKQLTANEITFEDAVSEKSQNYYTDNEGKLSRPYRYQLEIAISNKDDLAEVIALDSGAYSKVINTARGYTIYRGDGAPIPTNLKDDETLDVILTYIKTNEHGYIEDYYINIANDFISQAARSDFATAGEAFGVTPIETTAFPINYGSSSLYSTVPAAITELNTLATNADVLQKIFSLKKGEIAAPLVLGTNIAVFKCTSIITDDATTDDDTMRSRLASLNSSTLTQTLMTSDKVENNVWTAYFQSLNLGN